MTEYAFWSDTVTIFLAGSLCGIAACWFFLWSDFRHWKNKNHHCCKNYPWCNHIHGTNVKPND